MVIFRQKTIQEHEFDNSWSSQKGEKDGFFNGQCKRGQFSHTEEL